MDAHRADGQRVPAARGAAVMHPLMQDGAVRRAPALRPLVFEVDERPLPPAEYKMLKPGKLEVVRLGVDYPITVQVTPSGRLALSTEIV